MTITPNEISNKEFKKGFRGYDIDDVDEFLEQVVEDYEKLYKENTTLKEKIVSLNDRIEHYSNLETTLQGTLVLAQTAADQAKESSKREAEIIIKNAQETANDIIRKAEERVMEINKNFDSMKQQFNMFKSRFKALLTAQIDSIENESSIHNSNE